MTGSGRCDVIDGTGTHRVKQRTGTLLWTRRSEKWRNSNGEGNGM